MHETSDLAISLTVITIIAVAGNGRQTFALVKEMAQSAIKGETCKQPGAG